MGMKARAWGLMGLTWGPSQQNEGLGWPIIVSLPSPGLGPGAFLEQICYRRYEVTDKVGIEASGSMFLQAADLFYSSFPLSHLSSLPSRLSHSLSNLFDADSGVAFNIILGAHLHRLWPSKLVHSSKKKLDSYNAHDYFAHYTAEKKRMRSCATEHTRYTYRERLADRWAGGG
ncbi:hypothetical protein F5B17DRAFT_407965 [Nemania serpens]|nr:hypothetical protein F5B17DRAFT_407965 [Nemania serpens]